jgi:hypothetical protein
MSIPLVSFVRKKGRERGLKFGGEMFYKNWIRDF